MSGHDDVTVLLPVRDGARWLPTTLASVRRLRGVVDVLVVDDGSTDETPALVEAAKARDPRLRLLRRRPEGLVPALNAGLAATETTWIARLDADDVCHPDRVVLSVAHARAHGLQVVGTGVRCFPTQRISRGLRRYEAWQNSLLTHAALARARFVESPLVHPSVLFHRDTVRAVGGYQDHGWPEDYDLWLRLFAAGARFGKVARPLTFWRDHGARLTRTAAHCAAERVRACKVHHLLAGPLVHHPPTWIAGTGKDARRIARLLVARGLPLAGWLDVDPRSAGRTLHGATIHTLDAAPFEGDAVVLGAVGGAGRRGPLAALMAAAGFGEGERFWSVA